MVPYIDTGYWATLYVIESFLFTPNYGAQVSREPRVLKAQFGDGYAQRTGNGININPQVWSLTFNRNVADTDEIDAFLEAHNGISPFLWTTPKNAVLSVICPEWSRGFDDYGSGIINAKFEQVFE